MYDVLAGKSGTLPLPAPRLALGPATPTVFSPQGPVADNHALH